MPSFDNQLKKWLGIFIDALLGKSFQRLRSNYDKLGVIAKKHKKQLVKTKEFCLWDSIGFNMGDVL